MGHRIEPKMKCVPSDGSVSEMGHIEKLDTAPIAVAMALFGLNVEALDWEPTASS